MTSPIRVLVVDDSPLFSEVIQTILEDDPAFKVVGIATNGQQAVSMTTTLRPSIITMDVQMPVMDGLEAVERIMADTPTPILIVTGDPRAGTDELNFEALRRGALDVFPKPTDWQTSKRSQHNDFRRHLKFLAGVAVVRHVAGHRHRWRKRRTLAPPPPPPSAPEAAAIAPPPVAPPVRVPNKPAVPCEYTIPSQALGRGRVVAFASSTGGPSALARILEGLPDDFVTPILITQHIPDGFAPAFASWLDDVSPMEVTIAQHGEKIERAHVYVASDGSHLTVGTGQRIVLDTSDPVDGYRPSGSPLFASVARAYGRSAVGIILSGMGGDGVTGLGKIREAGGMTIAQDEASCVVYGMPKLAVEHGAAMVSVPLADMAHVIPRIVER